MNINSDINILGGLPDFNLVMHFLYNLSNGDRVNEPHYTYTSIKTDKSVKRFEKAIVGTFLQFKNNDVKVLTMSMLNAEDLSSDSLLLLFWNSSINNELLHYLNSNVYFPAFYSGRLVIKKEEVSACIIELKESKAALKDWTITTINTVGRKYLTLLKKFNLMQGGFTKSIIHPYLNDKMFVLFVYWLSAVEKKSNLLESEWLIYSFNERSVFIERLLQKKYSKFFHLTYTGDKLKIETNFSYDQIYYALK